MAEIKSFRDLDVYKLARAQALDCGYLDHNQHRALDDSWQTIGAMLNRMIERSDDFCRRANRS